MEFLDAQVPYTFLKNQIVKNQSCNHNSRKKARQYANAEGDGKALYGPGSKLKENQGCD